MSGRRRGKHSAPERTNKLPSAQTRSKKSKGADDRFMNADKGTGNLYPTHDFEQLLRDANVIPVSTSVRG